MFSGFLRVLGSILDAQGPPKFPEGVVQEPQDDPLGCCRGDFLTMLRASLQQLGLLDPFLSPQCSLRTIFDEIITILNETSVVRTSNFAIPYSKFDDFWIFRCIASKTLVSAQKWSWGPSWASLGSSTSDRSRGASDRGRGASLHLRT